MGIASPGDVPEEREAVKAACERLNQSLAPKLGVHLAIVMWEDQASGSGRPQALINTRLDEADVLIGLMHRKWGTPTGEYSSGFEEEFERARLRRGSGNHPEIKMYFKHVDAASVADPGPQFTKVLAFKKSLRDANDLLYGEFESAGELERDVYDALLLWLLDRAIPAVPGGDDTHKDELKYRLARAIPQLPDDAKVVFTLSYFEGLTSAEIGEVLGLDQGDVNDAVGDAVRQLATHLSRDGSPGQLTDLLSHHLDANSQQTVPSEPSPAAEPAAQDSGTGIDPPNASSIKPAVARSTSGPAPTQTASASVSTIDQLKAWLPSTDNHIRIQDLIEAEAGNVRLQVRALPTYLEALDPAGLQDRTCDLLEITRPLLEFVCAGVRYDRDQVHTDAWIAGLQVLLTARPRPVPGERYQDLLEKLRHYPALLCMRAASTVAVARDRDQVLIRLMTEPTWRAPQLADARIPAAQALHEWRLFDRDTLLTYPRFTSRWFYPTSVLLRQDLHDIVSPFLPNDDEYDHVCDAYEYRAALITQSMQSQPGAYQAGPGNFIGENSWEWGQGGRPQTEVQFQARADRADDAWPWWPTVGGPDQLPAVLADLREHLRQMRRFG